MLNEHFLFRDPFLDELNDFSRLALRRHPFHVQVLEGVVDCLYLDLVQF